VAVGEVARFTSQGATDNSGAGPSGTQVKVQLVAVEARSWNILIRSPIDPVVCCAKWVLSRQCIRAVIVVWHGR
jgi:hypothetical protein